MTKENIDPKYIIKIGDMEIIDRDAIKADEDKKFWDTVKDNPLAALGVHSFISDYKKYRELHVKLASTKNKQVRKRIQKEINKLDKLLTEGLTSKKGKNDE